MRPITDTIPKPLVKIAGRTLLDRGLDSLAAAGVEKAVVNVHYFPEQIVAHVAVAHDAEGRRSPTRATGLLDSAGGIVKALPQLGREPFYILNADTFWIDRGEPNLARLALAWDAARMDILLMLADLDSATGHTGGTDFLVGRRRRAAGAPRGDPAGLIYAGCGDRQSAHLRRRARRAAVAQPLFRRGDRRRPAVRHADATAAGSRSARPTPSRSPRQPSRGPWPECHERAALPRVFSIPPGAPFLPTLAEALLSGRLVPDFRHDGDPLALADVTIYVPTRRAARELRAIFVEQSAGGSAILPTIRPLGEFDEDEAAFDADGAGALDLAPPISAIDRLLLSGAAGARLEERPAGRMSRRCSRRRSWCRPRPPMPSGWRATSPR